MKSHQQNQRQNSEKQRKSITIVSCAVAFFVVTLGAEFLGRCTGRQETVHALVQAEAGFTQLTAPTAPRIQSICFSPSGNSSIYAQGRFVTEGDIIDGFRILKIYATSVEFEKDGKVVEGFVFSAPKALVRPAPELRQQAIYKGPDDCQIQNKRPAGGNPLAAEMGSYYDQTSESTNRPETVDAGEYYGGDNTCERSRYQSPPVSGSASRNSETYLISTGGHRVEGKTDFGNLIRIEDGVLLQVTPIDRGVCVLCLRLDDIITPDRQKRNQPYYLINAGDIEQVEN